MANSTYLFLANKAPTPTSTNAVTQTAAGGIGAGTYSFIVVAWYRSRRTDASYAGLWKHSNMLEDNEVPTGSLAAAAAEYYTDWENVTVTDSDDDCIVLKWNKVDAPVVTYAIYYQTAAALDLTAEVLKVAHTETDNGDGTISGSIISLATDSSNIEEYLVQTAADPTNTFTVAGDVRACFYDGMANPVLDNTGAAVVTGAAFNSSGNHTVVTTSTALSGDDTWVRYYDGIKNFSQQSPFINDSTLLDINPVIDRIETPRTISVRAFNGVYVPKSYAKDALADRITLVFPGMAMGSDEYNHVLRCARAGHRMLLYDVSTSYTPFERGWWGVIEMPDYLNTQGKRARPEFEFTFMVEQGWSAADDATQNIIT